MPRPRSHHGRGGAGSQVIPTGWADAAASVVERSVATSGCTVRIGPPGGASAWNAEARKVETPTAAPVYEGPAEIMLAGDTGDGERTTAEVDVQAATYQVRLPVALAGVEPGHQVLVVTDPDLPAGAVLTVTQVAHGSRRFSRLVYATLND